MNETHLKISRPLMPQFEIVLPAGMHDAIREFLFRDSSREYMGVILAGVNETDRKVKLLGRRFIPVPTEAYEHQSAGGLAVRREYSQQPDRSFDYPGRESRGHSSVGVRAPIGRASQGM